jgi:hypothetical protein
MEQPEHSEDLSTLIAGDLELPLEWSVWNADQKMQWLAETVLKLAYDVVAAEGSKAA